MYQRTRNGLCPPEIYTEVREKNIPNTTERNGIPKGKHLRNVYHSSGMRKISSKLKPQGWVKVNKQNGKRMTESVSEGKKSKDVGQNVRYNVSI